MMNRSQTMNQISSFLNLTQDVRENRASNRGRKIKQTVMFSSLIALVSSVCFANTSEISWDDLLSPGMIELSDQSRDLQQRFRDLGQEKQTLYRTIASELALREQLEEGVVKKGDLSRVELDSLEENLSEKNPEALKFWDEVSQLNNRMETENAQVNPTLDGKTIRMPGYVLPLQSDSGKVYEFMLVPYVGACVHTPPPPLNQLVFVKSTEGFSSEDLYTPVWVEGVMSTKQANYDLSYGDGNRDVEAGYSLDAESVKVYEQ